MIDFAKLTTTKKEAETIVAIAKRAQPLGDRLPLIMDIEACHGIGCPLDLDALLAADDMNFNHDIGGIVTHLSRSTGELSGCFVPRFAKRDGR